MERPKSLVPLPWTRESRRSIVNYGSQFAKVCAEQWCRSSVQYKGLWSAMAALLTSMNANFGCRHVTRRPSKMKDQNSVVKSWKVCVEMLFSSQKNLEWVCWNNLMPQYNPSKLCETMFPAERTWSKGTVQDGNLFLRNTLSPDRWDDEELHLASSPLVPLGRIQLILLISTL